MSQMTTQTKMKKATTNATKPHNKNLQTWLTTKFPMGDNDIESTQEQIESNIATGGYLKIPRTLPDGSIEDITSSSSYLKISGASKKIKDNSKDVELGKFQNHGVFVYLSHIIEDDDTKLIKVCGHEDDVKAYVAHIYGTDNIEGTPAQGVYRVDITNMDDRNLIKQLSSHDNSLKVATQYPTHDQLLNFSQVMEDIINNQVSKATFTDPKQAREMRSVAKKGTKPTKKTYKSFYDRIKSMGEPGSVFINIDKLKTEPESFGEGVSKTDPEKIKNKKFRFELETPEHENYTLMCSYTKNAKTRLEALLSHLNHPQASSIVSRFDNERNS